MNYILKFVIIALLFTQLSCSSHEGESLTNTEHTITHKGLSIKGKLLNGEGTTIYLFAYKGEQPEKLDSAVLDNAGNFELSTLPNGYGFYGIGKNIDNVVALLLKGDENVELLGDMNDIMFGCDIKGSKDTEIMSAFTKKHKTFFDEMQVLKDSLQSLPYDDIDRRDNIIAQANDKKAAFDVFKYDYIKSNSESPAIYMAAPELYDIIGELEYLKIIEKTLSENMNGSLYHTSVAQKVAQAEQAIAMQEQQAEMIEQQQKAMAASGIAIGMEAPELNYPGTDGKNISLKNLKGKIVLLDFWASWCKPCRMENPNVVKLYNEYKDKGFTIYSFSLDQNPDRWKTAIEQDGLIWPNHSSDLKGWSSQGAATYKVNSIPQTFLLDKDGKIVAIGLRGQQLEQKLKELLG